MAEFVKGDVVVIPFPFSDLSGSKKRPAFVLANLMGNDIILCQVTSKQTKDQFAITISNDDFKEGSLPVDSNVRPTRIFTADKNIIVRKAGTLKPAITDQVTKTLINLLNNS